MKAVDKRTACIAAALALSLGSTMTPAHAQVPAAAPGSMAGAMPDYYGDLRPDAPALAVRGTLPVGVRTQAVEHADQLDILHVDAAHPDPRAARRLVLEIWYPARLAPGQAEHVVYTDVLGSGPNDPARPNTPFQFAGRAARDAAPAPPQAPANGAGAAAPDSPASLSAPAPSGRYPLVIVSHGYPGSRLQMSYLTENLASKGYVVVAIDHAESTRADKAGFASTLLNRRLDDLFVLDTVAAWAQPGSGHFLAGLVDVERTALIGYSMGGYGALNTVGTGISASAAAFGPAGKLAVNQQGNPAYEAARTYRDGGKSGARIKAVVAFAPWGGAHKVWDAAGLAGVRTPVLFVAGDQDDVAGYRDGVLPLFEGTVHAERWLLTYQGARHNTAPNPPSPAAAAAGLADYMAYAEPVWDSRRINNINQHFVTAFLGVQLKDQPLQAYLDLPPQTADGTIAPDPGLWKGFQKRAALGLAWRYRPAQ